MPGCCLTSSSTQQYATRTTQPLPKRRTKRPIGRSNRTSVETPTSFHHVTNCHTELFSQDMPPRKYRRQSNGMSRKAPMLSQPSCCLSGNNASLLFMFFLSMPVCPKNSNTQVRVYIMSCLCCPSKVVCPTVFCHSANRIEAMLPCGWESAVPA